MLDDRHGDAALLRISLSSSIVFSVSARAMPAVGSSSSNSLVLAPDTSPFPDAACHRATGRRDHVALFEHVHIGQHLLGLLMNVFSDDTLSMRMHPKRTVTFGKAGDHHVFKHGQIAKISGVWNTRLMPIWLISCGLRPSTDCPSNMTDPVSGISLPTSTFSRVDLPAPFGPMIA